jgi:hypothetical protein
MFLRALVAGTFRELASGSGARRGQTGARCSCLRNTALDQALEAAASSDGGRGDSSCLKHARCRCTSSETSRTPSANRHHADTSRTSRPRSFPLEIVLLRCGRVQQVTFLGVILQSGRGESRLRRLCFTVGTGSGGLVAVTAGQTTRLGGSSGRSHPGFRTSSRDSRVRSFPASAARSSRTFNPAGRSPPIPPARAGVQRGRFPNPREPLERPPLTGHLRFPHRLPFRCVVMTSAPVTACWCLVWSPLRLRRGTATRCRRGSRTRGARWPNCQPRVSRLGRSISVDRLC